MITICWWPHLHFDGLIEATGRREGQKCLAKEENGQKSKFFVESHWKFEFLQFWLLSLNFSSSTKKKILSKDPQRKKINNDSFIPASWDTHIFSFENNKTFQYNFRYYVFWEPSGFRSKKDTTFLGRSYLISVWFFSLVSHIKINLFH